MDEDQLEDGDMNYDWHTAGDLLYLRKLLDEMFLSLCLRWKLECALISSLFTTLMTLTE